MYVFFPARLIPLNENKGNSQQQLEDAASEYMKKGLVILDPVEPENVKDALKIMEFSKLFPYISDPKLDGVERR